MSLNPCVQKMKPKSDQEENELVILHLRQLCESKQKSHVHIGAAPQVPRDALDCIRQCLRWCLWVTRAKHNLGCPVRESSLALNKWKDNLLCIIKVRFEKIKRSEALEHLWNFQKVSLLKDKKRLSPCNRINHLDWIWGVTLRLHKRFQNISWTSLVSNNSDDY